MFNYLLNLKFIKYMQKYLVPKPSSQNDSEVVAKQQYNFNFKFRAWWVQFNVEEETQQTESLRSAVTQEAMCV